MEWLDRFLVADKPFFARLVPPRATFPMDMTAEERALMEQHAQYVRKLLAQGKGLVFGPVMDPKGAYGIGVLQVKDEETAKKLLAEDPVVRAERGFRWELLPMASVVV